MELNAAIKDYMKKHGIKQSYIVEKCGWTSQKTSRIIRGKQRITADDMRNICNAFDLPYEFFYAVK